MNPEILMREARALESMAIEHRRHLHIHAETGFDLNHTRKYISDCLKGMKLQPHSCGRSGIVCTLGKPGKTLLLRADMDALPMTERSGLPFACTDGCMHACGHDMHAAMLLTAAQLIKHRENELSGCIKLMFQPAEELLEGARDMIEAGVLENPRVDGAAMLHVLSGTPLPTGTAVIAGPGISAPAAGIFEIEIFGRGGHGAMPHDTADPVNAAAHIILALQEILTRELPMQEAAALTLGAVQAGSAANAIAERALIRGSYRCFSDETEALIRRRMDEISRGIAESFRTRAELRFTSGCPALKNDASMCAFAEKQAAIILGKDHVLNADRLNGAQSKASGSEDFAWISRRVPSVMIALAAGNMQDGYVHPLHHPEVRFDEAALVPGAALYAMLALTWQKA